jgi:cell division protease FtsH
MGLGDILRRPEFFAPAGIILLVAVVALLVTRPWRHRSAGSEAAEGSPGPDAGGGPTIASATFAPAPEAAVVTMPAGGGPVTAAVPVPVTAPVVAAIPTLTFADVAGLDQAVAELQEIREYLASPERYEAVGAKMPGGVLLHGPPGCGKTLLAKALAGEAGVTFFPVSASSFVEQFVGLGAARVRELFEKARAEAPSIIFIDELDAVGRNREEGGAGSREFDNTLNQLLVELDGFEGSRNVLLLAATNRPELIDPALLRPGRFDRRIRIERPDREGREQILRLHARSRPFSEHVPWSRVAADSAGLTAAELATAVNEAALLAARRNSTTITPEDLDEALDRHVSGLPSSRRLTADEKRLLGVHEAGHALLTLLLRGVEPPPRVSILSRRAGFSTSTWAARDEDETLNKRELMTRLIVLLGGRAAEFQIFGQPTTEAADDLKDAATLARSMVERWAMTGRYELAVGRDKVPYMEGSAGGEEVRSLISGAEAAARSILADHEASLRALAAALSERETLSAAQMLDVHRRTMAMQRPPEPPVPPIPNRPLPSGRY